MSPIRQSAWPGRCDRLTVSEEWGRGRSTLSPLEPVLGALAWVDFDYIDRFIQNIHAKRGGSAMSTITQKGRIQAGVDLLTERFGPGWACKIDLPTLDLGDTTRCVLGQLARHYLHDLHDETYVGFRSLCHALGITTRLSDHDYSPLGSDHGFNCQPHDYLRLTTAWRRVIRGLKTQLAAAEQNPCAEKKTSPLPPSPPLSLVPPPS